MGLAVRGKHHLGWSRVEAGGGDGGASGGRSDEHGGLWSEAVAAMVRNLG